MFNKALAVYDKHAHHMTEIDPAHSHNDTQTHSALSRKWYVYLPLIPLVALGLLLNVWVYKTLAIPALEATVRLATETTQKITGQSDGDELSDADKTPQHNTDAPTNASPPGTPGNLTDTPNTADPAKAHPLVVDSAREVGNIGAPQNVTARDGGASIRFGDRVLWTFGDTLYNPKAADGSNGRSNTAAIANHTTPLQTNEPTDNKGAPFPFIPFTTSEQQYNTAKNNGEDRYAIWPSSIVPIDNDTAAVYFIKIKVNPGYLAYEFRGSGVAYVNAGSTEATRQGDLVFDENSSNFTYGRSSVRSGNTIYAYACTSAASSCTVARVNASEITNRSSYTFWDGSQWVSDIRSAAPVISGPYAMFSVSWNEHLQRYLAVYMPAFSRKVMMRTSLSPEGPWSSPVEAFTAQTPANGQSTYAGLEHVGLSKNNGRTLYISYYLPTGAFTGNLRLVEVNLK